MKTILLAAVVSLLTSILCTPMVVAYFRRRGFGQEIRTDGPQTHLVKRGTPTMGGSPSSARQCSATPSPT